MIPSVVGYKGFQSYGNTPYSAYKPGQTTLDREYYDKATRDKPDGKGYLGGYSRFGSVYNKNLSETVKPSDYKNQVASTNNMTAYEMAHNPDLFRFSRVGLKSLQRGVDPVEQLKKQQQTAPISVSKY